MSHKKKPVPGLTPAREFPYYKLRCWDDAVSAWMDIPRRFDSLDDLYAYAMQRLDWNTKTQVVTIRSNGRRYVDKDFDAFGEPR